MSRKKIILMCVLFTFIIGAQVVFADATIRSVAGEVKIRRGVEETWQPAAVGMVLKDMDTILTGRDGIVSLSFSANRTFRLGNNSMLDIVELREISEKELFLFLMSRKVEKIEPGPGKTRLRIGNVSVVHGEAKAKPGAANENFDSANFLIQEKNGARALFEQELYPNAIIKYHKILGKYNQVNDCGEIYFYLGKAFEAMSQPGQAIDAFEEAIDQSQDQGCNSANSIKRVSEAGRAIKRLRSKS